MTFTLYNQAIKIGSVTVHRIVLTACFRVLFQSIIVFNIGESGLTDIPHGSNIFHLSIL